MTKKREATWHESAAGVAGHGYPPVAELETTVRPALRGIVVPGLAEAGLDAAGAERELAAL